MKFLFAFCSFLSALTGSVCASDFSKKVEVTIMAIGDSDGGKLKVGSTGCAIMHVMNHNKKPIDFPTLPVSLGKGGVHDWDDASYLSPKQGENYGYGYRAAHRIPRVRIEFLTKDGKVIHTDSSLLLQEVGLIEAGGWKTSALFFSTPSKPGSYLFRFIFDNTPLLNPTGRNSIDAVANPPHPVVVLKDQVDIPNVPVIALPAKGRS